MLSVKILKVFLFLLLLLFFFFFFEDFLYTCENIIHPFQKLMFKLNYWKGSKPKRTHFKIAARTKNKTYIQAFYLEDIYIILLKLLLKESIRDKIMHVLESKLLKA
jgi:hypothetical protein